MFRAYDRRHHRRHQQLPRSQHLYSGAGLQLCPAIPPKSWWGTRSVRRANPNIRCISLIRLNFDLMTSFSLVPLQMFSLLGMLISLVSACSSCSLVIRRLIIGPEAEGLFTLFALMFFLIGIALFGIGLLGEYIGRIYQQVRHRPRYLIEAVLEQHEKGKKGRGEG